MHGWPSVHKHAAVKSVVFQVTYSHSVKLRSSVLGDIGPLTVRCIPSSEVCNSPAGNHSSVCASYLICMFFFPSKWKLWVNIPYSLVFKWDFTAHRVQVLVSSRASVLICGQVACPRCFWMCFGWCSGVSRSLRSILPAASVTCSEQSWSHRCSPFPSNCSSGVSWAHVTRLLKLLLLVAFLLSLVWMFWGWRAGARVSHGPPVNGESWRKN